MPVRLNPASEDLVRLNAVQPGLVPALTPTGFKLVELPPDLASRLRAYSAQQLAAANGVVTCAGGSREPCRPVPQPSPVPTSQWNRNRQCSVVAACA